MQLGISPDLKQVRELGAGRAARHIRDAGLCVATVTHRSFAFQSRDAVASARKRLEQTVEIAAEVGAKSIIMTTGGRGALTWQESVDRFVEAVSPCAALARAAGIVVGIEPTSHLYADASIAHRLSDTLRIAEAAGISMMIDTFACWFDADIEQAIPAAVPRTSLVQVSDYVYGDRGLPCRAVPGDGNSNLDWLVPGSSAQDIAVGMTWRSSARASNPKAPTLPSAARPLFLARLLGGDNE